MKISKKVRALLKKTIKDGKELERLIDKFLDQHLKSKKPRRKST